MQHAGGPRRAGFVRVVIVGGVVSDVVIVSYVVIGVRVVTSFRVPAVSGREADGLQHEKDADQPEHHERGKVPPVVEELPEAHGCHPGCSGGEESNPHWWSRSKSAPGAAPRGPQRHATVFRMTSPALQLLELLWQRYAEHVPYAGTFVRLAAGRFDNDHVAFRSVRRPGSGIALFAPVFERLGWRRAGTYDFPDARLDAIHLSHPDGLPRIFLSELRAAELSPRAQEILSTLPADEPPPIVDAGTTDAPEATRTPVDAAPMATPDRIAALAAWFCSPGIIPSEAALLELERESQYGAWLLLFGREVNHFTATVDDVEAWARRMADAGVPMKGEIEGAPGAGLRQTATRAAPRVVRTDRGDREWPYAYLEIAQRSGGFDGFVAAQARQLFEMTKR